MVRQDVSNRIASTGKAANYLSWFFSSGSAYERLERIRLGAKASTAYLGRYPSPQVTALGQYLSDRCLS